MCTYDSFILLIRKYSLFSQRITPDPKMRDEQSVKRKTKKNRGKKRNKLAKEPHSKETAIKLIQIDHMEEPTHVSQDSNTKNKNVIAIQASHVKDSRARHHRRNRNRFGIITGIKKDLGNKVGAPISHFRPKIHSTFLPQNNLQQQSAWRIQANPTTMIKFIYPERVMKSSKPPVHPFMPLMFSQNHYSQKIISLSTPPIDPFTPSPMYQMNTSVKSTTFMTQLNSILSKLNDIDRMMKIFMKNNKRSTNLQALGDNNVYRISKFFPGYYRHL